jgi:hypothetical protein
MREYHTYSRGPIGNVVAGSVFHADDGDDDEDEDEEEEEEQDELKHDEEEEEPICTAPECQR